VENGMRDEPQGRGGPQPNAAFRSDHTDAESHVEEQLNNPNIADEVLIKKPVSTTPGTNLYHTNGATSIKSPFTDRNIPLNATIMNTTIQMARLLSVIFIIYRLPL
jgi:hypothetical protein